MSDVTFSEAEISQIRARKSMLQQSIADAESKIAQLESELKANDILLGLFEKKQSGASISITSNVGNVDPSGPDKTELVLKILRDNGGYLAPVDLKRSIKAQGVSGDGWGNDFSYVHQILGRQVKRGTVKKHPSASRYKATE